MVYDGAIDAQGRRPFVLIVEDGSRELLFESRNILVGDVVPEGRVVLLNGVCPNIVNICALKRWE